MKTCQCFVINSKVKSCSSAYKALAFTICRGYLKDAYFNISIYPAHWEIYQFFLSERSVHIFLLFFSGRHRDAHVSSHESGVQNQIWGMCGRAAVDLFALQANAKCPLYVSQSGMKMCPNVLLCIPTAESNFSHPGQS